MADLLTILGTLASVVGAVIAVCQAKSAKKYSSIASDAKDEIIGKYRTSELTLLLNKAHEIMVKFSEYKDKSSYKSRGIDKRTYGKPIDEFINLIVSTQSTIDDEMKLFF